MTHFKNGLGIGSIALLALGGAVACGNDFSGNDCKASRTCPASDGGAGPGDSGDAGSESMESGGESSAGNTGSGGSAGGAGGQGDGAPVACAGPEECDDGNADNGKESCGADGMCAAGNPPPAVLSVSPDVDAIGVQPDVSIAITFSEPLDPATVTTTNIQVFDGEIPLAGELVYEDAKVTLTLHEKLPLLAEVRVSVSTSVTDVEGTSLLADYSSSFTTRDGAWSVSDVDAGGRPYVLSSTVPMTAKGDALVSWISSTGGVYCPAAAQWFNSGSSLALTKSFSVAQSIFECYDVAAGANAEGVAAVAWREEVTDHFVAQYRATTWTAPSSVASTSSGTRRAVGVAPNGAISLLVQGFSSGTFARSTYASGVWGATAKDIATGHAARSSADIAFDPQSNGFAVWRAEVGGNDEILVARYTPADGWLDATVLPGSESANANATNERGAPAIAMDSEGGAMTVWVQEANAADKGSVMASRYTASGGWQAPVPLSGALSATHIGWAPGLVFDGATYVAVWTAKDGATLKTYSSRYDTESSEWGTYELRSSSASLDRMPSLGADAHQNLIMTWMTGSDTQPTVAYARFNARTGEWSQELDFSGGIVHAGIAEDRPVPLGVAANGHAALVWFNTNAATGVPTTIRLASFY
jgi:hypothetical protein